MSRSTPQYQIELTLEQVETLAKLARNQTATFASVQRARLRLLAHTGIANSEIARRVGWGQQTMRNWRWHTKQSLQDVARSGAPLDCHSASCNYCAGLPYASSTQPALATPVR
jgi:hypothetical protein